MSLFNEMMDESDVKDLRIEELEAALRSAKADAECIQLNIKNGYGVDGPKADLPQQIIDTVDAALEKLEEKS